jgi:hypothetical protein
MSPAPAQVPAQIPSSIDHSRRASGKSSGPIACQALVRNDGTTSSAAACAGVMTTARRPMATVGSPRPTTPLTKPASTKIDVIAARAEIAMRSL